MTLSGWLPIALTALLIALAPLAHASPPDASWIPGIYDDADFDDVVTLVTLGAGSVDATPLDGLGPQPVAVAPLPPIREQTLPSSSSSSSPTRGPPTV
jgi:hypothetical protein